MYFSYDLSTFILIYFPFNYPTNATTVTNNSSTATIIPPKIIMNESRYANLSLLLLVKTVTSLKDLETPGTPQNYALRWLTDSNTTTTTITTTQLQALVRTTTKTMKTLVDDDENDDTLLLSQQLSQ